MIGPHLPKLPPKGRIIPQAQIEKQIYAALADIPDVRVMKLNDRGERDLSFNLLSKGDAELSEGGEPARSQAAPRDRAANVSPDGALPRPELQIRPRAGQMSASR